MSDIEEKIKHTNMTQEEKDMFKLTGSIGGQITRNKYGPEHFRMIGARGAAKRVENARLRAEGLEPEPRAPKASKGPRTGRKSAVPRGPQVQPPDDPLANVL